MLCRDVRERQVIFPKNSLLTQEHWEQICRAWRKRVTYAVVSRLLLENENYRSWNLFRWEDYIQRIALIKTFNKRHLPITNGSQRIDVKHLPNPKQWLVDPMPKYSEPGVKRRKPTKRKLLPAPPPSLIWDDETEAWVQND